MPIRAGLNTVRSVAEQYLNDLAPLHGPDEARAITRLMFRQVLGLDIRMDGEHALSESELLQVWLPLKRLRAGEPVQYVIGHAAFMGLRIAVDPRVLIPRPETEELVDRILHGLPFRPRCIVDVGTGSGCIALALKQAWPSARVVGIDKSADALDLARANAGSSALSVEWVLADALTPALPALLMEAMDRPGNLVVSNPPYVPGADRKDMAKQVLEHEPHLALFVEDHDPHLFHRTIAAAAFTAMHPRDELWLEGHHKETPASAQAVRRNGFATVEVLNDLSGNPRFIHAVK